MHDQKIKLLTDVELELMNILWSLNQATVKEVIEQKSNELLGFSLNVD